MTVGSLYLTRIRPNPPGKDTKFGSPRPDQLVNEWVEFAVIGADRNLSGDALSHRTHYSGTCTVSGFEEIERFTGGQLKVGNCVRVHTGTGTPHWEGSVFHHYLGRSSFIWNNRCGDEARLAFQGTVIDFASYAANPGERILTRIHGTNYFN